MAGSDMEKAADMAQDAYQGALNRHGHHGRAFIETLVKLCREHPNIVGIGVGLLVEQLLSEEKREFDRKQAQALALADAHGGEAAVEPHAGAPVEADSSGAELARSRRRQRPSRRRCMSMSLDCACTRSVPAAWPSKCSAACCC